MPSTSSHTATTPSPARMVALLVPFAYFFHSRVPTTARKLGWVLNYLAPVLTLAAAAHGGWPGMLPAAIMLVAVYAAYEFGYLVNDTVTIERETEPTLRLDESTRLWMRAQLGIALAVRAGTGLVCLAALTHLSPSPQQPLLLVGGWLALWPCFALYNHWRGRITIGLHFVLVGLRFLLPILAAVQPHSIAPHWLVLLWVYPLVNTIEAMCKPRYGLSRLMRPIADVYRFRVAWHGALLLCALVWLKAAPVPANQVLAALCGYYFGLRVFAWWFRRLRHVRVAR